MTVHISERSRYKAKDGYAKKMGYTTSVFGCTYRDYQRIRSDPYIKSKYVVWYSKPRKKKERR